MSSSSAARVLQGLDGIRGRLEDFYRDLHAHPELSLREERTAAKVAERLREAGFEVTKGSAAPASSACCATATGRWCCCVPTWTRCR